MPQTVTNGAMMTCSQGSTPANLSVLPIRRVNGSQQPIATESDHKPMVNIAPFGLCMTTSNPQVAAATAAANGSLTPQPCLPVTSKPWAGGSKAVQVGGSGALNMRCTLTCQWMGVIKINIPGQVTVHNS